MALSNESFDFQTDRYIWTTISYKWKDCHMNLGGGGGGEGGGVQWTRTRDKRRVRSLQRSCKEGDNAGF